MKCHNNQHFIWSLLLAKVPVKGLVNLKKNETYPDLNNIDERHKMLKNSSKNSNRVKSFASFKIMQISKRNLRPYCCLDVIFQNVFFNVVLFLCNKNSEPNF